MNIRLIYLLPVAVLVLFSGCVLEEAKKTEHPILNLYTNEYNPADTLILNNYEKKTGVKIQLIQKDNEALISLISEKPYNSGVDMILVSGDSVLRALQEKALLHTIRNEQLFTLLNREFYNTHHQWLPFSHNPLVLVAQKDSSTNCPQAWTVFQQIMNDSIYPSFSKSAKNHKYAFALSKSKKYKAWIFPTKKGINLNYSIISLSELTQEYNSKQCYYYLTDSKKHLSSTSSLAIMRYGRNHKITENFLQYYTLFKFEIAASRNELSTFKSIKSNYAINQALIN